MSYQFPRATRFAFRNTCEYACAVERPAPNHAYRILWVAAMVLALLGLCRVLMEVYS